MVFPREVMNGPIKFIKLLGDCKYIAYEWIIGIILILNQFIYRPEWLIGYPADLFWYSSQTAKFWCTLGNLFLDTKYYHENKICSWTTIVCNFGGIMSNIWKWCPELHKSFKKWHYLCNTNHAKMWMLQGSHQLPHEVY